MAVVVCATGATNGKLGRAASAEVGGKERMRPRKISRKNWALEQEPMGTDIFFKKLCSKGGQKNEVVARSECGVKTDFFVHLFYFVLF